MRTKRRNKNGLKRWEKWQVRLISTTKNSENSDGQIGRRQR